MNRVEFFRSQNIIELQETINCWCKHNGKEPISISITYDNDARWYVAAVIVKECEYE